MLKYSRYLSVHLFSSLLPPSNDTQKVTEFSPAALEFATTAIKERSQLFANVDLLTPFSALAKPLSMIERRKTMDQFNKCIDILRGNLYQRKHADPLERLQIHEAIMAAGFYQRTISTTQLEGENIRFVLNHYNFDVRRDVVITQLIQRSLLKEKEISEDSEKLLRDILLLERRLYGPHRFLPTSGRRWLVLGLHLSDIDSEEELLRIMNLSAIKEEGNFLLNEEDCGKHWKLLKLTPGTESISSLSECSGVQKDQTTLKDAVFELRIQKPIPPLDFWERLKEKLLRYWVIWFSLWVMFFMVDEEIITLVALIVLKWKQTRILEEEAERTGGKVYIASSIGRSL